MKPNQPIFAKRNQRSVKQVRRYMTEAFPVAASVAAIAISTYAAWITQAYATDTTVKKDYVQIAVQILREPRRQDDTEIRTWATEMVNKNSPVPLSEKAADQLSISADLVGWLDNHPLLSAAMKDRPACPTLDLSAIPASQRHEIESLEKLCKENFGDLLWLQTYLRMLKDDTKSS